MNNILITGSSGFIGKLIIARLIENPRYEKIYMLLRPGRRKSAAERSADIIKLVTIPEHVPLASKKIIAVTGDLALPGLGLSKSEFHEIVNSVDQILHIGATTDFASPIEASREINVGGTQKVLDLADTCHRQGRLKRFDYVSTAFVAGIHKREAAEHDLDRGQTFANPYEQSKFEAELLVRKYAAKLPVAVYRPSIVIGDSHTGYVSKFSMLYWPLKILAEGIPKYFIPGSASAMIDVVPSDYVADSIVALMQDPASLGETFHLTAGRGNEVELGKIVGDACAIMGLKKLPLIPIWIVSFLMQTPMRHTLPKKYLGLVILGSTYTSYFEGKSAAFNAEKSAAVLKKFGISAPKWDSYKDHIFNYCKETSWGRSRKRPDCEYYRAAVLKTNL